MENYTNRGYIIVTDTVPADGSCDVSDAIQQLIDENPNRTIFFPDGIYRLDKPICTPAHPQKSVDLQLSNYAVLQAGEGWDSGEAMVRLGAIHPANDIRTIGSNYSFSGGIVDGMNKARGISIDGGRETHVQQVSIKHTTVGIHIKRGANSGSSDADITQVNIVGSGGTDSVGVMLEGYDNTLTNMRIANVFVGVKLCSSGNCLRNIHPLYTSDYTDYVNSCGFWDLNGNNWYDYAYSDHFSTGFRTSNSISSTFDNCFCWWYSAREIAHTAFRAEGKFNSVVTNYRMGFYNTEAENKVLSVDEEGGRGVFHNLSFDVNKVQDQTHMAYLVGKIL